MRSKRRVLSIKLNESEYEGVLKKWMDYIYNTGNDVSRHGFIKSVLLREEKVCEYLSQMEANTA